jgi:predicted RNA-binding Zn-ribbon protein involved in translation (DUF1610 family)
LTKAGLIRKRRSVVQNVEITRIDNFICPACGEVIKQVAARDGMVKGWCPHAKKEIKVILNPLSEEKTAEPAITKPLSYLDNLKQQREKVLRDVVSAREDGDLKENSAYHAAREQLSILDDKILKETARIKRSNRE